MRNRKPNAENRPTEFLRRLLPTVLFVGMLAILPGCALVHHYDAINGKVVDLDTGEPIEGAAVHASYYTDFYTLVDGTKKNFIYSYETLTDSNGKFTIKSKTCFTFRPMNLFNDRIYFVIYKQKFGCFGPTYSTKRGVLLQGDFSGNKIDLVGLPKLTTIEDRISNTSCLPVNGSYETLLKLLNKEREELGLSKIN